MRKLRVSDGGMVWDDFDGLLIERYTRIGCARIHMRLYSTALYGIEEGITRGLWPDSFPSDSKENKPAIGQRSRDISAISATRPSLPIYYQIVGLPLIIPNLGLHTAQRQMQQFSQLGMPLSRAFQKLIERGFLCYLGSKLDFTMLTIGVRDMTPIASYLRYAIQDLIDQGLVNLGQPSVTTNPLPAHTTHSVPPPTGGIYHMDFVQDDVIPSTPSNVGHGDMFVLFILWHKDVDVDVQVMTHSGRIAQAAPLVTRPFGGTNSREEILVVCSGHESRFVLLDNGYALNVCPLATVASTLHPRFWEVMGTLIIDFLIGLTTFSIPFQVLRILASFNRFWVDLGFTKDRVRARLSGIPFDYLIRPYTFNLADYFVRGSKVQPRVEEMGVKDSIVDELQHMLHQM
ncbi:hypothetical protein AAG906_023581 [Vitis piasezkii]